VARVSDLSFRRFFLPGENRIGKFLELRWNHPLEFRNRLKEFEMRRQLTGSFGMLVALLAFSPIVLAQTSQPSETKKAPPASSSSMKGLSHDLSGVWMQYDDGTAPGFARMNAVDDRTRPPLTPWGQAKFDAAKPLMGPRAVGGQEDSAALHCDPSGPPQLLILPNPWEIVQNPGRTFFFYEEYHIWRTVWTDGRPLPKDPDPTWLGYSVGHWEGDTFVVETVGFNDKVWADLSGNPRSEQMHLTERYRRLNHDTLEQQIIIDDPKSYTQTWVSPPKLHKLEPTWEIAEWFCASSELATYDKDVRKPSGGGSAEPNK
jgi:hypothetical protein